MTRKDFALIADAIRYMQWSEHETLINRAVAEQIGDALATTNPRFSRDRFIAACMKPRGQ